MEDNKPGIGGESFTLKFNENWFAPNLKNPLKIIIVNPASNEEVSICVDLIEWEAINKFMNGKKK